MWLVVFGRRVGITAGALSQIVLALIFGWAAETSEGKSSSSSFKSFLTVVLERNRKS